MKIYIIERGTYCQHGHVFKTYATIQSAILDLQTLSENRRKEGMVITYGLGDDDNAGLAICGFWAGPKGGNETAEGWRIIECTCLK